MLMPRGAHGTAQFPPMWLFSRVYRLAHILRKLTKYGALLVAATHSFYDRAISALLIASQTGKASTSPKRIFDGHTPFIRFPTGPILLFSTGVLQHP